MGESVPEPLPRILFLDHVGELGGAEMCLIDLVRHAEDRSKTILMADGPLRGVLESLGADVSVQPLAGQVSSVRRHGGIWSAARAVPHVIRIAWKISRTAKCYDIIWATSQKSFVIGCMVSLLSRRPLVWHMHDILTADHFSNFNRRIAVTLANLFASRVVAVSKAGKQSFIDCKGREAICCVVYNGIASDKFDAVQAGNSSVDTIRSEFGIGNAPLVGVFGRLTAWKGQHVLIHALPLLPGVHAVIVGEALFGEEAYAVSLRELAKKLGVADRAHFTGFRENVPRLMTEVSVIAHTSTSPEPFGRVLVEAMLARRPLIASASGGATEIVTDGHDGLLITPGNPPLLAKTITDVLNNHAVTQVMVANGYDTAIERFGVEHFISGTNEVAVQAMKDVN